MEGELKAMGEKEAKVKKNGMRVVEKEKNGKVQR